MGVNDMPTPKVKLDMKVVEGMAFVGATNQEIADFFGCSEKTIRNRCSEILSKSHADRKIKLRDMQWKAAEKGNTAMLIWLGKQHLGQSEKVEQNNNQTIIIKEKMLDTSAVIDNRIQGQTSESLGPVGTN